MASCTKPKPPLYLLISLLIVSQISVSNLRAKADEQLIEQECHNAEVPTTCLQCVKSDTTSLQADRVGIAKIIVKCLNAHLDTLVNNVTSLVSVEKKKPVKTALEDCGKGLSRTKRDLSNADNGLTAGDYDNAGHSVRVALENPLSCEASLRSLEFAETPDVYYQLKIYEELSNAAMRIIDRL